MSVHGPERSSPKKMSSLTDNKKRKKESLFSPILILVWMCFCCDYILMTMQIPLFPLLNESPFLTGLLFASKAAMQIISSPVTNSVIDKCNKKLLLLFGLGVEILSIFLFFIKRDFNYWLFGRMLSGIAAGFISSSAMAALQIEYSKLTNNRDGA